MASQPALHAVLPNSDLKHENADVEQRLVRLKSEVIGFLRGKQEIAEVVLSAIFASGHILFEDVPGVGKTTLIKAIAKWLGLDMTRIQCTSDLLPSEIIGVETFSTAREAFIFHPGPIFSNIVLVDELNRASPRTQSALLEGMAEGLVSVNRKTYPLPQPFIVFATQNPSDYIGTYPLPESQLDRFAAKLHLSYPSDDREREILGASSVDPVSEIGEPILNVEILRALQARVAGIHVADRVVNFAKKVIDATRNHKALRLGVSTRGAVGWIRMSRAHALLSERNYVTPDDLLFLAQACLGHRLVARSGGDTRPILEELLGQLEVD